MLSRTRSCQTPNIGGRRVAIAIGARNVARGGRTRGTETAQRRCKIAIGPQSESTGFQVSVSRANEIFFLSSNPLVEIGHSRFSSRRATNV